MSFGVLPGSDDEAPRLVVVGRWRPPGCFEEPKELLPFDAPLGESPGAPAQPEVLLDLVFGTRGFFPKDIAARLALYHVVYHSPLTD